MSLIANKTISLICCGSTFSISTHYFVYATPSDMANAVTVVSTRMCERVLMRRLWYQLLPGVRWRSTPAARPHATIDRVIRIDHAGEFGANRIYAGQHAVLRRTDIGQVIQV